MADKEATVYIIDLGKSMGQSRNGRDETDLDLGLRYLWHRILNTVGTGRKTTHLGILGLRTDATKHSLQHDESYGNINTIMELKQCLLGDIHSLKHELQLSKTNSGDAISSIVVAIGMIEAHCKKLKYIRRIVLITDARGVMDGDDNESIAKQLSSVGIEFTVAGVDFDDPSIGFKEENKHPAKTTNEKMIRNLAELCGGQVHTLPHLLTELEIPTIKAIRSVATFKGSLTIGDFEKNPDSSIIIDVERYPHVMQLRAASAKLVVSKTVPEGGDEIDFDDTQSTATIHGANDAISAIKKTRDYVVEDPDAPGGKKDVDITELERGFEYGRTAVNISKEDEQAMHLECLSGLQIMGFIEREKFPRYLEMSRSSYIVAARADERHAMALGSFIHALIESNSYAIARLVTKAGKDPTIVLLAPHCEPGFECLVDSELPFLEDIRHFHFPPLDKVLTVSGKVIKQHRNLPSEKLQDAMSEFVDAMDLTSFDRDSEGVPTEYGKPADTYSPLPNHTTQAVRARAMDSHAPIPEPYSILTKFRNPPEALLKKATPALEYLTKVAEVKKVPPRQKGRARREVEKPLSGLDVDGLLRGKKTDDGRVKISSENAVPEFKRVVNQSEEISVVREATKQFGSIIDSWISKSVGSSSYGRAIEGLRVIREEMEDIEENNVYNDLIIDLKKKVLSEKLGGDRKEFWYELRKAGLGPLDIGDEEKREFYKMSL